ncbi:MAG TPA: phosphatase PAP2 family protein, partial [Kineosporiaceae bacterium]|nr:phosphatase PAP2 family protein [Kineosporiaceae bacterium]
AMPSLHVGWSSWCAFTVWTALCRDRPVLGWAAWLFPAVMTLVVLGTGNHYVLDIAGSALVLTGGVLAGSVAGRAERPGWTDVEGRPQA